MNDATEFQRTAVEQYGYWGCQQFCRLVGMLAYRIRCFGQANFPTSGGGLILANHQSNLDPVLIGMCAPRRMNYLAKKSLFNFKPLGRLIGFLDAIPLEREGIGIAGIKETIRRTRRGELLLLFPEGARTYDGAIAPLLPGAASIAKRSQVPLVPVGIDGAYHAWPRKQRFPGLGHVVVTVDRPIPFSDYGSLSDEQVTQLVAGRIRACHQLSRRHRERMF
jgi:1-acyl-sn-glycerol-3-phosphate acyltransferase